MNKNAFTLAEMLVAVVILGTLAAITIPTFLNSSSLNNTQYVNGLKKAYTELSSATDQIMATNGGTMINIVVNSWDDEGLRDKYCRYLKCTRICNSGAGANICYSSGYKGLHGDTFGDDWSAAWYSSAVLSNGMHAIFYWEDPTCNKSWYVKNGQNSACGLIEIDVNGFKSPNRVGRDIFIFYPTKNGLVPAGAVGTEDYDASWTLCNPTSTDQYSGYACAGKILWEGTMTY